MTTIESEEERHRRKMQHRKAFMDEKIAAANVDRGVLVVNTGAGKGKTSSGFGMVMRALGHGMRVGVVQFVKGRADTGEKLFLQRFPDLLQIHVMGEGYTWETQDKARDIASATAAWEKARALLRDPKIDLVLLDELNIALRYGYLEVESVLRDLKARPAMQHVVITGRNAPPALIEAADTVTDMSLVKHAFKAGVRAQKGLEW
jgi:cob(I)alamin adenosyltransferase